MPHTQYGSFSSSIGYISGHQNTLPQSRNPQCLLLENPHVRSWCPAAAWHRWPRSRRGQTSQCAKSRRCWCCSWGCSLCLCLKGAVGEAQTMSHREIQVPMVDKLKKKSYISPKSTGWGLSMVINYHLNQYKIMKIPKYIVFISAAW